MMLSTTSGFFNFTGLLYASGLAATLNLTHLLNAGDHVISMDDVYGGLSIKRFIYSRDYVL